LTDKGRRTPLDKFDKYNVNEEIRSPMVRLVGEGSEVKIIPTEEALKMARQRDLDLVEISPNQDPPVVKIIDYSKFKFELLKKSKEAKKKQKVIHIKEIKMRPNIDEHDFSHKMRHAKEFLDKGDKVKFTLMFRGREMAHPELGFMVMNRIREALGETVGVEKNPSQDGRNITMVVFGKPGTTKGKEGK